MYNVAAAVALLQIYTEPIFEVLQGIGDLPKKICSIIVSWNTSTEILSNAVTLINKLCVSGM